MLQSEGVERTLGFLRGVLEACLPDPLAVLATGRCRAPWRAAHRPAALREIGTSGARLRSTVLFEPLFDAGKVVRVLCHAQQIPCLLGLAAR